MNKKGLFALLVLFILISSIFAVAQEDIYDEDASGEDTYGEADNCGIGCKVWQFLFGNPENRAGRGWFEGRETLAGGAAQQPSGDAEKAKEARKLYSEGEALYKQGKYRQAISKFQRAFESEAGSGPQIYLARSYERIGDKKGALGAYEEAKKFLSSQKELSAEKTRRLTEANNHILALGKPSPLPQPTLTQGGKTYTYVGYTEGGYPVYRGPGDKLHVGSYDGTGVYEAGADDVKYTSSSTPVQPPAKTTAAPTPAAAPTPVQPAQVSTPASTPPFNAKDWVQKTDKDGKIYSVCIVEKCYYSGVEINKDEYVENSIQGMEAVEEIPAPPVASASSATPVEAQPSAAQAAAQPAPTIPLVGPGPGVPIVGTVYYVKNGVVVDHAGTPVKKEEVLWDIYYGDYEGAFNDAKDKEAKGKEEEEKKTEKAEKEDTEGKEPSTKAKKETTDINFEKKYDTLDAYATQLENIAKNAEENAKEVREQRLASLQTAKEELEKAQKELKEAGDKATEQQKQKVAAANTEVERLSKESDTEKTASDAKKAAEEARKDTDSIQYQWSFMDGMNQWRKDSEVMQGISTGFQSLQGLLSRTSAYQGLSNLLMPEETQKWIDKSNTEALNRWADLPSYAASHGVFPAPSESCDVDDVKRSKTPGQSTAFVRTQAGTYQFVGSIQAEKSATKSKMLCERNPDEEAEEEFICGSGLVCKEDQFCYENEDAEEPAEGFFYKITWGVTAPQDEKFTPYIDENGIAIRFNLALYSPGSGEKWIFKRAGGYGANVITLTNGARDGGTIVKYLRKEYNRVCIKFDPPNSVIDYFGDNVDEICTDFVTSSSGSVEYSASGGMTTTSSTSEQVTMDI